MDGKRHLPTILRRSADRLAAEIDECAAEQRSIDELAPGGLKDRRQRLLDMRRSTIGRKQQGVRRALEAATNG